VATSAAGSRTPVGRVSAARDEDRRRLPHKQIYGQPGGCNVVGFETGGLAQIYPES